MMTRILGVIAAASLLSACTGGMIYQDSSYGAPPPQPYGAPYQAYPYGAPPPSYGPRLSDLQQHALIDGCQLRYSGTPHKLRACLNLGANWEDALAQGCQKRYSGIPHKLRECMQY